MPEEIVNPTETPAPQQPETPAQDDGTDWKAEARKWEARARQNNAKAGTAEQQRNSLLQSIAQALGLEKAPDDPKQLADNLTAAQREAADARRELTIHRVAAANGANPNALVDSASFLRSVAQIDPADSDAIAAAIKAAVEANPNLGSGVAPGAGFRDASAGRGTSMPDADMEALKVLGF